MQALAFGRKPGARRPLIDAEQIDQAPEARAVIHLAEMGDLVGGEIVEDVAAAP